MNVKPTGLSTIRSLAAFLKPKPTTPVDRRRALQLMGGVGVGAAGVTLGWDVAQPKKTTEVVAPEYVPTSATSAALPPLINSLAALHSRMAELLRAHLALFVRSVAISYTVDEEEEYQFCTEIKRGTEIVNDCVTKTRKVPHTYSAENTLTIDQDLQHINKQRLDWLESRFGRQSRTASALNQKGLKLLEGQLGNTDWLAADPDKFAENFRLEWKEGQVGNFQQIALAAAIGLPASAAIVFYNEIANHIAAQSAYLPPPAQRELQPTRRAFVQLLAGAGAAIGVPLLTESNEKRTAAIRSEGEKSVRQAIVGGNSWQTEPLFQHLFGESHQALTDGLKTLIDQLNALIFNEVSSSVKKGLRDLDAAEAALRLSVPFGAYNVITTRKDDEYGVAEITAYVRLAHSVAGEYSRILNTLRTYFEAGVPEALLPAMRAYDITTHVDRAVAQEHSAHLWGLAGDLGWLYGSALVALLASEIRGPHHEITYNLVQGACDFIDRRKMSAFEIVDRLRGGLSSEEMTSIFASREISRSVRQNVADLKAYAESFVAGGIVHSPVLNTYFAEMDQAARADLAAQVDKLTDQQIIEVYIRKALVFFTRQQLGPRGLLEAISRSRSGKDPIARPDPAKLKEKVLELIQQADLCTIYDLIDAGLINDNEPNENWLTAERCDLGKCINYWADRVAGNFTSSQTLYATLEILPPAWLLVGGKATQTIGRADVLAAFDTVIREELTDEKSKMKALKEIKKSFPSLDLSEQELAARVLLHRMEEAVERHQEIRVLFDHVPKLKSAVVA